MEGWKEGRKKEENIKERKEGRKEGRIDGWKEERKEGRKEGKKEAECIGPLLMIYTSYNENYVINDNHLAFLSFTLLRSCLFPLLIRPMLLSFSLVLQFLPSFLFPSYILFSFHVFNFPYLFFFFFFFFFFAFWLFSDCFSRCFLFVLLFFYIFSSFLSSYLFSVSFKWYKPPTFFFIIITFHSVKFIMVNIWSIWLFCFISIVIIWNVLVCLHHFFLFFSWSSILSPAVKIVYKREDVSGKL